MQANIRCICEAGTETNFMRVYLALVGACSCGGLRSLSHRHHSSALALVFSYKGPFSSTKELCS